jgi:hypothetical protein
MHHQRQFQAHRKYVVGKGSQVATLASQPDTQSIKSNQEA